MKGGICNLTVCRAGQLKLKAKTDRGLVWGKWPCELLYGKEWKLVVGGLIVWRV